MMGLGVFRPRARLGLACLLAAACLGAARAAAPDAVDLRRLQRLGATLPEGPRQGDLLLALAGTAEAAEGGATDDWKARDYDDLYALLQKYRDELRELGLKDQRLQRLLEDLAAQSAALSRRLDKARGPDGLKIHGRLLSYYDDVNLFGAGAAPLMRGHFRGGAQRAELALTYARGPLRGLAEVDFQYLFGNQYDGATLLGVQQVPTQSGLSQGARQLYVELLSPLELRVGTLSYRQTRLTFWRNEDDDPYLPEPFAGRRARLREDLLLDDDHAALLRGLRLRSAPEGFFGGLLHFSALALQPAQAPADPAQPGVERLYQGAGVPPADLYELYNTYLGAASVRLRLASLGAELGLNGSYTGDSADSVPRTYGVGWHSDPAKQGLPVDAFSSAVYGASLELSPAAWVSLRAEGAASSFRAPAVAALYNDPAAGPDGSLQGSAADAALSLRFGALELRGRYGQASRGFTSAPAQGRTWDAAQSPLGPFETENSRYDPQSGGYGDIRAPRAPESAYNRAFIPAAYWYRTPGGAVVASAARQPYHPGLNALDPYGAATPNRVRYGGGLHLNLPPQGVEAGVDGDLATEAEGFAGAAPQAFSRLGLGARFDLQPWIGWALSGSGAFVLQSVRGDAGTAFDSARVEGGLAQGLWGGAVLQLGWRHLDDNGVLPYRDPTPFGPVDPVLAALGRQAYDEAYDQWSVGFSQDLGTDLNFSLNYGSLLFDNGLAGKSASAVESRAGFQADQGYARLSLAF